MAFKAGDRVKIVAGKYKHHGAGTYKKARGTKQAVVAVDGDSQETRNLYLTSIEKVNATEEEETITITKREYEMLLTAIKNMKLEVEVMEQWLRNL